jgi:uncharacterized protein (TIGR02453 family)
LQDGIRRNDAGWSGTLAKERTNVEFLGFQPALFQFLEQLADNNNRPWFQENKRRYEDEVLEPSRAFIRDFRPRLKKISGCFVASDRRMGGSLMRIYRDTRFSHDKTPYKTNVGIQFRHQLGRDVHAPGFYVHLAPGESFLGVGLWRPDSSSLRQIRQAIVEDGDRWRRATGGKRFREYYQLGGDRLKRAPRGFDRDDPHVEDLKRTDFVAMCPLTERQVLEKRFAERVASTFAASRPFMRFLCDAIKVPF